ncbi:MAG: glycoside hydrolase family 9 protein [Bacteroidales bacterium]|nr:glycoside hydrolase family 9 protein [Bacteroidales bacterium]
MKRTVQILVMALLAVAATEMNAQEFKLLPEGYLNDKGVDVMAFDDIYPEGHQGGVSIIMHGHRIATNGDIRMEATPGQWQPVPKQLKREFGENSITATLCFPDSSRHMTGFNPMIYPDFHFNYTVKVEAAGRGVEVTVDLDRPVPDFLLGKVGFNLEFFPGYLFGKPWIMDGKTGIFPRQANAPLETHCPNHHHPGNYHDGKSSMADFDRLIGEGYSPIVADDIIGAPYAIGKKFTSNPEDPYSRVTIESLTGDLKLYDGRVNHNNGWFVLRSEIAAGATKGAIRWIITPEVVEDWMYKPVVQVSQVGYHPSQQKQVVIELDSRDTSNDPITIYKIEEDGEKAVKTLNTSEWGKFLRYRYLRSDFTDVTAPGLYRIRYRNSESTLFRIDEDVYDRGVWQPVIEYFLPVQMCHMRVNEKYRVWHGMCHMDDALMAPAHSHIDGYDQKPGLSKYKAGEIVYGVNIGGWHDAGDYDLRVESQAGESYILALAYETFRPEIDVTSIDQHTRITEIHQADGKNDILQQVEHGALSVVSSYLALGRLYRGIICNSVRQYVLLGDAATMTDGIIGNEDDRWIFTEDNPGREMSTAAELAGVSRVLKGFNDTLSVHCLNIAEEIFDNVEVNGRRQMNKVQTAAELFLSTGKQKYRDYILDNKDLIMENFNNCAWYMARVEKIFAESKDRKSRQFSKEFRAELPKYMAMIDAQAAETPYGVPYRPAIWGAGWNIQSFAFRHYFMSKEYPDVISSAPVFNALNFVLGCHPGLNRISFASGVGTESATTAYGVNRADWSYIPGGVASGTALIRPDFPELLDFPFLWQQMEYCLGGASSHYMFMVLAVKDMLR